MEAGGGIVGSEQESGRSARVTVPDGRGGERLDRLLAELLGISRTKVQRLIAEGRVAVDDESALKPSMPVEPGQTLAAELPDEQQPAPPKPHEIDLRIVHEDEHLVVLDKPAGLVVHPGAGEHEVTLVSGLLHRYGDSLSSRGGEERPGIVHRLDKGTSGVMAVARTDAAHDALAAQFAARTVEKEYTAVVYGCPREPEGRIDLPLGRDRADRTKISADTDRPRDAVSNWALTEDLGGLALLEVRPETGRMHQVRAHLASIHHACVGDPKYSGAQWRGIGDGPRRKLIRDFPRPALHARRLRLEHPEAGEPMEFEAPLATDMVELIETLRRYRDEGR